MTLSKAVKCGCVALSSFLSLGVFATETTWEWDMTTGTQNTAYSSVSFSGTNGDNSDTLNMDMTAWADTGADGETLESGEFYYYNNNSWGVVNNNENVGETPEHSFDNIYESSFTCPRGYNYNKSTGLCRKKHSSITTEPTENVIQDDYDMALISFDTSVELTDINFGYTLDGDFTLVAYTGDSAPTLGGETWASLSSSGDWLTVGQYNGEGTGYYSVNADGVSSSYWLVGAYNSVFGEATDSDIDSGNDAFKIKKLVGTTSDTDTVEVNSPATLGLLLAGGVFCYIRRRKS